MVKLLSINTLKIVIVFLVVFIFLDHDGIFAFVGFSHFPDEIIPSMGGLSDDFALMSTGAESGHYEGPSRIIANGNRWSYNETIEHLLPSGIGFSLRNLPYYVSHSMVGDYLFPMEPIFAKWTEGKVPDYILNIAWNDDTVLYEQLVSNPSETEYEGEKYRLEVETEEIVVEGEIQEVYRYTISDKDTQDILYIWEAREKKEDSPEGFISRTIVITDKTGEEEKKQVFLHKVYESYSYREYDYISLLNLQALVPEIPESVIESEAIKPYIPEGEMKDCYRNLVLTLKVSETEITLEEKYENAVKHALESLLGRKLDLNDSLDKGIFNYLKISFNELIDFVIDAYTWKFPDLADEDPQIIEDLAIAHTLKEKRKTEYRSIHTSLFRFSADGNKTKLFHQDINTGISTEAIFTDTGYEVISKGIIVETPDGRRWSYNVIPDEGEEYLYEVQFDLSNDALKIIPNEGSEINIESLADEKGYRITYEDMHTDILDVNIKFAVDVTPITPAKLNLSFWSLDYDDAEEGILKSARFEKQNSSIEITHLAEGKTVSMIKHREILWAKLDSFDRANKEEAEFDYGVIQEYESDGTWVMATTEPEELPEEKPEPAGIPYFTYEARDGYGIVTSDIYNIISKPEDKWQEISLNEDSWGKELKAHIERNLSTGDVIGTVYRSSPRTIIYRPPQTQYASNLFIQFLQAYDKELEPEEHLVSDFFASIDAYLEYGAPGAVRIDVLEDLKTRMEEIGLGSLSTYSPFYRWTLGVIIRDDFDVPNFAMLKLSWVNYVENSLIPSLEILLKDMGVENPKSIYEWDRETGVLVIFPGE